MESNIVRELNRNKSFNNNITIMSFFFKGIGI